MDIAIIACRPEQHSSSILEILNEAIVHSTSVYDYRPRPLESMAPWFAGKLAHGFPVIGAVDSSGALAGFATYGTFRAWPAYKYSVEHSVYVHKDHRSKGIGRMLLRALIDAARAQDLHLLIGGIDATNQVSIALHERIGFRHTGTIHQAGFKFGRWLDLAFYELHLDTPHKPADG
jgi:phosphinothricin acetyltransferase